MSETTAKKESAELDPALAEAFETLDTFIPEMRLGYHAVKGDKVRVSNLDELLPIGAGRRKSRLVINPDEENPLRIVHTKRKPTDDNSNRVIVGISPKGNFQIKKGRELLYQASSQAEGIWEVDVDTIEESERDAVFGIMEALQKKAQTKIEKEARKAERVKAFVEELRIAVEARLEAGRALSQDSAAL